MINIIFRKYKYLFNVNIKLKIGNINNNSFIERALVLLLKVENLTYEADKRTILNNINLNIEKGYHSSYRAIWKWKEHLI